MTGRSGKTGNFPNRSRRGPEHLGRQSGVTLIETLVATAVALVIFGVVFGIYDATSRLTRRSVARESMWAETRLIGETIERALQGYVAPEDLRIPNGAKADRFGADEAVFYCSKPGPGGPLWRVRVANRDWGGATGQRVVLARRSAAQGDQLEQPSPGGQEILGTNKGQTTTVVRFRHAYRFNGLEPVWTAEARPGERPRLIEYDITVAERKPERGPAQNLPPVRLVGATAIGG